MKWSDILSKASMELAENLGERALQEREAGKIICPSQENIFRALELTPPDKVKVCIVGQDPYHTPDVANGLAFSVSPGSTLQPSLRNIFKEYREDLGLPQPTSGDLSAWAERGVLLLNTSLTVEAHNPNSHAKWGWHDFTAEVFHVCALLLPQPIVFLVWGADARSVVIKAIEGDTAWEKYMNMTHKVFLFSSHPSPFSASRATKTSPAFLGSKPFSTANNFLIKMGAEPVDWRLE